MSTLQQRYKQSQELIARKNNELQQWRLIAREAFTTARMYRNEGKDTELAEEIINGMKDLTVYEEFYGEMDREYDAKFGTGPAKPKSEHKVTQIIIHPIVEEEENG